MIDLLCLTKTIIHLPLKLLDPYHISLTVCDLTSYICRLELPHHLTTVRPTSQSSSEPTVSPTAILPSKPSLWELQPVFLTGRTQRKIEGKGAH